MASSMRKLAPQLVTLSPPTHPQGCVQTVGGQWTHPKGCAQTVGGQWTHPNFKGCVQTAGGLDTHPQKCCLL